MDIDGSGGAGGGGHDDLPPSPSKKGRGSGKRLRKLKLRYATTSRPQVSAWEGFVISCVCLLCVCSGIVAHPTFFSLPFLC